MLRRGGQHLLRSILGSRPARPADALVGGATVQPPAAAAAPRSAGGSARGYAPRHGHAETDAQVHSYIDSHHPNEEVRHRPLRKQQFTAAQLEDAKRPKGPPAATLHGLADTWGVGNHAAFVRAVHRLPAERQFALMDNTAGVAAHLQALGIGAEQVASVLQHCPALFSFPAEERAQVLMGELMGKVGRTAEQAADLFIRCPALANTRHVMPSVVKLVAEHHGDD